MTITTRQVELARRFEPILYLHADERFLPADPKRYLESCALWPTRLPATSPGDWGQEPSGEWPRTPLVERGRIAGLKEEVKPGQTWIGDVLEDLPEGAFLNFAGWTAEAGFDPDLTEAGDYGLPDVDAVASRYAGTEALRTSAPWYYAEVLDAAALTALAGDPPPGVSPDNVRQILGLLDAPTLVLYHLFFPAHSEALPECDPVGAGAVFGSFAGEWACVAVLLENDRPTYLGLTRRNVGTRDATNDWTRLGMTLTRWNEVSTVPAHDTHPQVSVALGTHGLYADVANPAARHPESITSEQPDPGTGSCGDAEKVESIDATEPPGPVDVNPSALVSIAKLIIPPPFGIAWLIGEIESDPFGVDYQVGRPSDAAPTPETAGTVIAPAGVLPTAVQVWPTAGHPDGTVASGGRKYPFVMDRPEQPYWPLTDQRGFQGRWGAAVTDDPRGRRSGMRVPPFAQMFLRALARS